MYPGFLRRLGEQGIILFTSLAILSILLTVGIASRVMVRNDFRILTNLRGGTETFYIAAAGLEWSKREIARTVAFPPAPTNRTASFTGGNFAVSFFPPVVTSPLKAQIVVRSVGTLGPSSHTLQAQLTKSYDLADSAIALRGNPAGVNLSGSEILISGIDRDPSTGLGVAGASARAGISAVGQSMIDLVNQAAVTISPSSIDSASSAPPIAQSEHLPASVVTQLASDLCSQASAIQSAVPLTGALVYENQTWGSASLPQLRCIDGLASAGDSVTLAGTMSGAGILIVRDADLILTGALRWEGMVIVTGNEIGLKVMGSSSKEILGGVILNESGTPASSKAILDIQGTFRLLFSRQSLSQAATLIPTSILNQTYASLPALITQNYWRSVTP